MVVIILKISEDKMSLKDALLKAGLKSTKSENEREYTGPTKSKKKSELHQQERNFCEVCKLIHPDVERFKHKKPTVDAEWICSSCADKEEILDQFRMTNQSEFAIARRYRREFGATKDFSSQNKSDAKQSNNENRHKKHKNKSKKSNFKIDDKGEKNFNC
jgi:hypothetical protein